MERDLKQKRGLVGDQKKRLANLEEQKGTEREKIVREAEKKTLYLITCLYL